MFSAQSAGRSNSYTTTTTQTVERASPEGRQVSALIIPPEESPLREFDYRSYIDHLVDILLKYEEWNDPLSVRLLKWGDRTYVSASEQEFVLNAETMIKAKKRINKLLKNVLINPLDTSPLLDPVLERHWTWERVFLEDYQTLTSKSDYDNEEMNPMVPHKFARKMIVWANTIIFEIDTPVSASTDVIPAESSNPSYIDRTLVVPTNHPEVNALKLLFYQQFIQAAISREAVRQDLRGQINSTRRMMVQLRSETRALIAQEVERAERNAEAHEAVIDQRFNHVEQIHGETVDLLRTRIQDDEREIQNIRTELHGSEMKNLEQERSIAHLRACYLQKAREVESLRGGGKKRCVIS